jgi:hypothetical protein
LHRTAEIQVANALRKAAELTTKERPMKKQWSFALITAAVFALGVIGVTHAWAQNGVIGFQNTCRGPSRVYVMRGEAESASNPRVLLPLPPLVDGFQFQSIPLDVSTAGPVTILLYGLFASQVNDIGGNLVPDAPVNIRLAADPRLPANINNTPFAKFSPTRKRVALVSVRDLALGGVGFQHNRGTRHRLPGLFP